MLMTCAFLWLSTTPSLIKRPFIRKNTLLNIKITFVVALIFICLRDIILPQRLNAYKLKRLLRE